MSAPSPLWYASRGAGAVSLVLLTVSVVLGVATSLRLGRSAWPRFLSQSLHRNLSLLVLVFLGLHIATAVLDPFAQIALRDAFLPVGAAYRAVWLGLGVVAMELLVALAVTSLLRHRIGFAAWRLLHWAGYAAWPVAFVHGLGTGSDARTAWMVAINGVCLLAVLGALAARLASGWPEHARRRLGTAILGAAGVGLLVAWAAQGPLRSGWARAAGTPPQLLARVGGAAVGGTAAAPPAASPDGATTTLPAGLDELLAGSATRVPEGLRLVLDGSRDTTLELTVVVPRDPAAAPTLTVRRGPATLCSTPASVGDALTARCGGVALSLTLSQAEDGAVSGELVTRPATG